MSIVETKALDMSAVLLRAYELGDTVNASKETSDYLYWKKELETNAEAQALIRKLQSKKELFEECQRFGHFHPDYHAALDEVKKVQGELDSVPCVQRFKEAEETLDDLLYEVSKIIALSVSENIKVPSNRPLAQEGGCSSGGSCSGKCG